MSNRPSHLENLPRMGEATSKLFLLRELGYITFVACLPDDTNAGVFTLHRAEAAALVARLQKLIEGPDGTCTFVEGLHLGGPPTPDQLLPPTGTAGKR